MLNGFFFILFAKTNNKKKNLQIKITKIIEILYSKHPFILLLLHQPVYQTNPLSKTNHLLPTNEIILGVYTHFSLWLLVKGQMKQLKVNKNFWRDFLVPRLYSFFFLFGYCNLLWLLYCFETAEFFHEKLKRIFMTLARMIDHYENLFWLDQ